jgi:lipopolysaccharide heptosyltransferase I
VPSGRPQQLGFGVGWAAVRTSLATQGAGLLFINQTKDRAMSAGKKTSKSGFSRRMRHVPAQSTATVTAAQLRLDTDSPCVLVSRMSAIGDTILTLPVACAIRDHYPQAKICWVVEEKSAPMVRNHEAIDSLIVLPRGWFTSLRGLREAREQLRALRCDVAIDCQGMTKSALACFLSGAKQRIGYVGKHARELSGWFSNVAVEPVFHHLTDRSLELLTPLGIHAPAVRWELPIAEPARHWARRYRNTFPAERIAIMNPGATWHSKRWLPERFGETAAYLRKHYGYTSLAVWGTSLDRAMASDIVATSGGTAVLAAETDLQHLAALIETADLFISNDTGPLHMSVAVGTPTIGLYGATKPGDSGPYGQTAIQKNYQSGSSRQRRNASNAAMCAIEVKDVCDAIDQLHSSLREQGAAA